MASESTVSSFTEEHSPTERGIAAFQQVEKQIKDHLIKSRSDWDAHDERMYNRVKKLSDDELISFDISKDLVAIRSAKTAYGAIILGKIRLPLDDSFIHVRVHDGLKKGIDDVVFHSLYTDEETWNAIYTNDVPIKWFDE